MQRWFSKFPSTKRWVFGKTAPYTQINEKNVYALFREADQQQIVEICIFCDEKLQKEAALMNRLVKAAKAR